MGIGDVLGCLGVLAAVLGGLVWMVGATAEGRRLVGIGIALAVIAPWFDEWLGELVRFVAPHRTEIVEVAAALVGLVLFVRIFGQGKPHERRVSLKRRVDDKE